MGKDHNTLFRMLADKTRGGKLQWQETAKEGAFIAAVKGVMVFRLESMLMSWKYHPRFMQVVHLEVVDEHGDSLFRIIGQSSAAEAAWRLAKHSAVCPHVEIAEAIMLLKSL